jgi:hypothetical protein
MAFDQQINYRVNIDDSNFQAKLTQMRASIDSTVGGAGGGFNPMNIGMMNVMAGGRGNFGTPVMGGSYADFGGQVAPVSFTPPAIAMQPHFGMFQIQQTLGQAGLAAGFGVGGIAAAQFMAPGSRDVIPPNMSYSEYINYSTRSFADRVGGRTAAVVGAAAQLGGSLAGGALGTAAGSALGGALFGAGMGAGIGGFIGGAFVGGPIGGAIVGAGISRGMENIGIQSALSAGSFRAYQGSDVDPLTGRGFNRRDRGTIASNILSQEMNDNRLNTTDYKQIMETGMQMDLFSGTRDAEDFGKKFKDLVATVKTVSSTLHTSLKEGMETIRGLRDMGVTDASTQQSMILGSEATGRMSGRTGMEMMAVGQTGAEMFRGTGISMQRGFEVNQQNTAMVRSMLNSGAISRETVAQAGGELGLAQQMTASALSSFQTLQGRGAMMAAYNPATGSLDPNMVGRMMSGDSMSIMAGAAGTMSNPANMFKFQAHQEDMISKMSPMEMQMFGIAQRMSTARTLQGAFGGDLKDIFMAESRRQGVSMEQIKTDVGMLTMDPQKFKEQQQTQVNAMVVQQNLEAARDDYLGPKVFKNMFTRAVSNPIGEVISGINNRTAEAVENISIGLRDRFFGAGMDARYVNAKTVTGAQAYMQDRMNQETDRAVQAAGGNVSDAERAKIADKVAGRLAGGDVIDASDGKADSFYDAVGRSFGGTRGSAAGDFLRAAKGKDSINGVRVDRFENDKQLAEASKASGDQYVKIGDENGKVVAISATQANGIVEARRSMQVSDEEVDKQMGAVQGSKALKALAGKKDVSVADLGKLVVGDKFSMETYMAGGYGKDVYARIKASAKSGNFYKAENEIHDASDTEGLSRILSKAGAMYSKRAEGARDRLVDDARQLISSDTVLGLVEHQNTNAMRAIAAFADGDKAGEQAGRALLRGEKISDEQIERTLKDVRNAAGANGGKKNSNLGKYTTDLDAFMSANQSAAELAKQSSGVEAAGLAGVAGPLTAQQMESLAQMAKSLETQINLLTTMQQKLAASFKK